MSGPEWVCLMYHDVVSQRVGLTGGTVYFAVPHSTFVRQLAIIQGLGLRGCSIAEAMAEPAGRVAISFDDGDLGQATHAFPALRAVSMTATFFVTTSWVGRAGYVTWDQLREMRGAGMSIQSHTHSHPFLSELDATALRDELRRSRELLDHQLGAGQRTTMIALPGGDKPRKQLRSIIANEGYDLVATSRWGVNGGDQATYPAYVKRCTIRGDPDDATFAATLLGNRWLAAKQGAREHVLAFVRSSLGPARYARWRRDALNLAGSLGRDPT